MFGIWSRAARARILAVSALSSLGLLAGVGSVSVQAQVAGGSSLESSGVRHAIAGEMQLPGPSVVTQGGAGGSEEPTPPAGGELVPGLSTAYSDTWRVVGHPMVSRIYAAPVNYKGADGAWHRISNRLVPAALGGYENEANRFSLQIPASLSSGVSLTAAGRSVSFTLQGARGALPSVSGSRAVYSEALASTDFEYLSSSTGVQETTILKDQSAPSVLRFALSASAGLSPRQVADGSIELVDGQGKAWFKIPSPVAYRPKASSGSKQLLPVSLSPSSSGWVLSIDTGESWLRSELATGPVLVDPTIEEAGSQNCTLESDEPESSECSGERFEVGYAAPEKEHHGLLKFNLSSLPSDIGVEYAKLGLYLAAETTTNSKPVGVYRVTRPWTTSATWDTYDGTHAWSTPGGDYANPSEHSDASVNPSVGGSTGWQYWYPTKMVQEWANGPDAPEQAGVKEGYENDGLIVKDEKDYVVNNDFEFESIDATSRQPFLEVGYEPHGVGSQPQFTILNTPLAGRQSMGVNVASGDLLLRNQALHIAGRGIDFDSELEYNNVDPEVHDYGRWTDSGDVQLYEQPGGSIEFEDQGAYFVFLKQANGTYITPAGIQAALCTASHSPCPGTLPTGVKFRLIYDRSQEHIDFNEWGRVLGVSDRYGNTLTPGYTEGISQITSWTDTRGRKIEYFRGTSNRSFTEVKDVSGGRHVSYEYEGSGAGQALIGYTDANGNTTHYHYSEYNLDKVTTPKGNVIKLIYDEKNRIKEIVRTTNTEHTTGPTVKFAYYAVGSAPSPCTAEQKATIVKDADWTASKAHETTYCVNVLDEVEKVVDANGNTTESSYNPLGNLTSTTAAAPGSGESGNVESLGYDEAGVNLLCVVTGVSTKTSSCPSRPDKSALLTSFSYKDKANPYSSTQVQNPEGNSTFVCFNHGEQEESEGHKCPVSETEQPAGSVQNKTDQLASENELKFSYNKDGTIKTSTDADGHTTSYEYDEKGNLKKIIPPTGSGISATTITVDADSRPHVITDGAGHIETITYNNDDLITKIEYSGTGTAKTINYEYDADGNLTKREDSTGTTKYTVDPLNRITKEELPGSLSNSYEYDAASNMISFTDAGGTTKYKYNGLNELESMLEPGETKEDTFGYDNDHRLTKITYPSGAVENYKLEPTTGRPETITAENVTGTTVPKLTYAYKEGENDTGLVQTLTESTGNTTSYLYDKLNRLTEAKTTGTNQSLYKYTLDGAGNRKQQTVNPTKSEGGETTYFPVNAGNEVECRQTVSGACTSVDELSAYAYDSAGEETAITPKSDTSGASFEYNSASELSKLTPSGGSAMSLSYSGTGQDDLTAIGSTTTLQNGLLGITREVNSSGTSYFARTPTGLLIDERTPSGHYNPLYDGQGDIIGLVNTSKKVERTFHYGPYGENIKSEGTQTIPYPFGYKGGYRMPAGNTGLGNVPNSLIHYGQRYYDPTTGRWTQQDPEDHIRNTTQGNRYLFAGSDPINLSDPSGETEGVRKSV